MRVNCQQCKELSRGFCTISKQTPDLELCLVCARKLFIELGLYLESEGYESSVDGDFFDHPWVLNNE